MFIDLVFVVVVVLLLCDVVVVVVDICKGSKGLHIKKRVFFVYWCRFFFVAFCCLD